MHLLLTPFCPRIILVEAGKVAIVPLIQRLLTDGCERGLAQLTQNQLAGVLRPHEIGGEGYIKLHPQRLEALTGMGGFLHTQRGQFGITPAGEQVFQVPITLAVPHQHQKPLRHMFLLKK